MSTSSLSLLASLAAAAFVFAVVDAKCQIFCHQWAADSSFTRCDNAEVKCASNLPEGFLCLNFSTSRPPRCLDMIPETDVGFNPRPRRYKPAPPAYIDYAVDKAPNVEYLQSKESV
uniref:DB domain-containing protein n=1 Tax=Panagrellus redivivus TaxID=6233 RepID=A0A7E4VZ77_PANRE